MLVDLTPCVLLLSLAAIDLQQLVLCGVVPCWCVVWRCSDRDVCCWCVVCVLLAATCLRWCRGAVVCRVVVMFAACVACLCVVGSSKHSVKFVLFEVMLSTSLRRAAHTIWCLFVCWLVQQDRCSSMFRVLEEAAGSVSQTRLVSVLRWPYHGCCMCASPTVQPWLLLHVCPWLLLHVCDLCCCCTCALGCCCTCATSAAAALVRPWLLLHVCPWLLPHVCHLDPSVREMSGGALQ